MGTMRTCCAGWSGYWWTCGSASAQTRIAWRWALPAISGGPGGQGRHRPG